MLFQRLGTALISSAIAIWPLSCFGINNPQAGFQSGIRIITYIGFYATFPASDPIGGVVDTGSVDSNLPGQQGGIDNVFQGQTAMGTGIDDHPYAITNAVWEFHTSWEAANPNCDVGSQNSKYNVQVPLNGYIENWICEV